MKISITILIIVLIGIAGFLVYRNNNSFDLPEGETVKLSKQEETEENTQETPQETSGRDIFVTDRVKHSIPLDEIVSGGPPKDGIPAIDSPEFISIRKIGDDVDNGDLGLGLFLNGEARFYPFGILVWHELVNDEIGDTSVLVSYCPLCATGVVFDRKVNGVAQEFGVSGRLWQSNLLMYNRTGNEDTESLWSQVLGEAVLGPETGARLRVISSDVVTFENWKKKHPNTKVLSRETGSARPYGSNPYGAGTPIIGASFEDDRLDAKAFVFGIEIDGKYKAYENESLPKGSTADVFAGETITIEKESDGSVRMFVGNNKVQLQYISGFWFSWLAVHPETELFK